MPAKEKRTWAVTTHFDNEADGTRAAAAPNAGKSTIGVDYVCSYCGEKWPIIHEMGLYERPASLKWYRTLVESPRYKLDGYCCEATKAECEREPLVTGG